MELWTYVVDTSDPSSLTIRQGKHIKTRKLRVIRPLDGWLVVKIYVNDEEKNCPLHEYTFEGSNIYDVELEFGPDDVIEFAFDANIVTLRFWGECWTPPRRRVSVTFR